MTDEQRKILIEEQVNKLLEEGVVISKNDSQKLNKCVDDLQDFLLKNKTARKDKGDDVDSLYGEYRELMTELFKTLKDIKYNTTFSKDDFDFIKRTLSIDRKYNRQDVFMGLTVKKDFLEVNKNKKESESILVTIDDITRISYLFSTFEIKGLGKDSQTFASVIEKIVNITNIYNHYDKKAEEISTIAGNWIQGLEPEQTNEGELISEPQAE